MTLELRYHGEFPPKQEPSKARLADAGTWHTEEDQEPYCALQAWAERQEEGQVNYLFLIYSPQIPPWAIAKKIVKFFGLDPVKNDRHTFIGVTEPTDEVRKPLYMRYQLKFEWQKAQFVQRGDNWVWQNSGYGVILPYQQVPVTAQEEILYEEQLGTLMGEIKVALAAPKQTFYLPTIAQSAVPAQQTAIAQSAVPAQQTAIAQHATASSGK